ncbi:hypothetical protein B7494_g8140 [Chlorociboria aeruginascens]|nr:hypothetical protein B7494_g8140 [Chlorociboria aeruginascens]
MAWPDIPLVSPTWARSEFEIAALPLRQRQLKLKKPFLPGLELQRFPRINSAIKRHQTTNPDGGELLFSPRVDSPSSVYSVDSPVNPDGTYSATYSKIFEEQLAASIPRSPLTPQNFGLGSPRMPKTPLLPTPEVFTEVARSIISNSQELNILGRVYRSQKVSAWREKEKEKERLLGVTPQKLPSWVPDWASAMEYKSIVTMVGKPYYTAGGMSKIGPATLSSSDPKVLNLEGMEVDTVTYSTVPVRNKESSEFEIRAWWPPMEDEHGVRDLYLDAFINTLIYEKTGYFGPTLVAVTEFMQKLYGKSENLLGWSFFMTKKGYLGVVLGEADDGDSVFVAYGSSVPFLVREKKEEKLDKSERNEDNRGRKGEREWELVGTAFVDGLMHGEAFVDLEEGLLKEECIRLV